ncbi:MAG TPA: hypothetical protein VGI33_14610 [Paenibacillus sp.]|jgi:hypothetical protein
MRIHLYLLVHGLEAYRKGKKLMARLIPSKCDPHNPNEVHVDVHEDEVISVYPSGFVDLRGKG